MLSKCSMNISDSYDGELLNLSEIIAELEYAYNNYNADAMSEYKLFLQGKKEALMNVIDYLKRIKGTNEDYSYTQQQMRGSNGL